jgi:hypothetical protein
MKKMERGKWEEESGDEVARVCLILKSVYKKKKKTEKKCKLS